MGENSSSKFALFKILRAHLLPLTNCAFNKSGDKFITGSYDRTCKVWDTMTGEELLSLDDHNNVVYTMAFNNPFGDKIVTGSFDKKAKIWDQHWLTVPYSEGSHHGDCLSFLRPPRHASRNWQYGQHRQTLGRGDWRGDLQPGRSLCRNRESAF